MTHDYSTPYYHPSDQNYSTNNPQYFYPSQSATVQPDPTDTQRSSSKHHATSSRRSQPGGSSRQHGTGRPPASQGRTEDRAYTGDDPSGSRAPPPRASQPIASSSRRGEVSQPTVSLPAHASQPIASSSRRAEASQAIISSEDHTYRTTTIRPLPRPPVPSSWVPARTQANTSSAVPQSSSSKAGPLSSTPSAVPHASSSNARPQPSTSLAVPQSTSSNARPHPAPRVSEASPSPREGVNTSQSRRTHGISTALSGTAPEPSSATTTHSHVHFPEDVMTHPASRRSSRNDVAPAMAYPNIHSVLQEGGSQSLPRATAAAGSSFAEGSRSRRASYVPVSVNERSGQTHHSSNHQSRTHPVDGERRSNESAPRGDRHAEPVPVQQPSSSRGDASHRRTNEVPPQGANLPQANGAQSSSRSHRQSNIHPNSNPAPVPSMQSRSHRLPDAPVNQSNNHPVPNPAPAPSMQPSSSSTPMNVPPPNPQSNNQPGPNPAPVPSMQPSSTSIPMNVPPPNPSNTNISPDSERGVLRASNDAPPSGQRSGSRSDPWIVPEGWKLSRELIVTNSISVEMFLAILRECTQLQRLSVKLHRRDTTKSLRDSDGPRIRADNIEVLLITTSVEPFPILDTLTLPKLGYFDLRWDSCHGQSTPRHSKIGLYQLMNRSRCPLRYLTLENIFPSEKELLWCLELPNVSRTIQKLVLRGDHNRSLPSRSSGRLITGNTLAMLSQVTNGSVACSLGDFLICPNLRTMELSCCDVRDGELSKMVDSRSYPPEIPFHLTFSYRDNGAMLRPVDKEALIVTCAERNAWLSIHMTDVQLVVTAD
ncbi:hypothetical protein D9615_009457 [Tricholomella constricta]|uniref:Uncharacterized protein n=1 Tax=Tricholomella constricta TaxID=117010 RepID=A0A8H5GY47_9AGAR|nr:hypothetical protein D9615_009457 [Tricholomella constricta]